MICRLFNRRIFIPLFVLYLAAVAILCFMRPESLPETEKFLFSIPMDKVAHFIMFLPYPALAATSFIRKGMTPWQKAALLAIVAVTGAGLAYGTEVLQAHTGYRAYEIADFKADLIGIAAGTMITVIGLLTMRNRL